MGRTGEYGPLNWPISARVLRDIIRAIIIWLAPWAGKMTQIARCDWLPERARWSHRARSGLPAVSRKQNFTKSHIINPLLTKFVRSRWLDIGLVLFFARLWTSTSSRSINTQKKNLASILPSWPHTWSITHTYLFFSSWAGGIQQTLQSDWFLERAEFTSKDQNSGRNPSNRSIFVHELAFIVNLSPFSHFHRRLINASLSLFTFRWQGKLL